MYDTYLLISPTVPHDTDRLHRKEHCECLTDLVVEAGITDLLNVDLVCLLEDLDLIARDGSKNTDSKTRSGEGMPLDQVIGNGEKTPESADLV